MEDGSTAIFGDCVIVGGGDFSEEDRIFLTSLSQRPYIIAADRGAEHVFSCGLVPDVAIGDFDSAARETKDKVESLSEEGSLELILLYPEKDDTDTEAALSIAFERTKGPVTILGGFGSRVDHSLANIALLRLAADKGREAILQDASNRVRVLKKPFRIEKARQYGRYVSLCPLTEKVEGLTLLGFKYPLENRDITIGKSLCISNEIVSETGEIFFSSGELVLIESKD